MVFWSGFIKKIKSSVSQLTFDRLKNRVDNIESDYATKTYTDRQDANLSNRITTNTNEIAQLRTEFDSKQYVNYRGNWNSTINYQTGDAITDNDLWYVSNVDNNLNHRPNGHSDTYWELISEPSIDLSNYYTKTQVDSFVRQLDNQIDTVNNSTNQIEANLNNNYYTKTQCDQNFTSFSTGLQLRSDVNSNTTAINAQARLIQNLQNDKSNKPELIKTIRLDSSNVNTLNSGYIAIDDYNIPDFEPYNVSYVWRVYTNSNVPSTQQPKIKSVGQNFIWSTGTYLSAGMGIDRDPVHNCWRFYIYKLSGPNISMGNVNYVDIEFYAYKK